MSEHARAELRESCNNDSDFENFDPECAHLEEWFGRIEQLKQQLEN